MKELTEAQIRVIARLVAEEILKETDVEQPQEQNPQSAEPKKPNKKRQLFNALSALKAAIAAVNKCELTKESGELAKMMPELSGMVGKVIGYAHTHVIGKK